ncbi:MAG TPA: hypothetical protein VF573_01250 [Paraburkholderia sp.]|uniref:hypothetical protein n=1 Tax=Paraburkholderia sp. TaxID=1926495 RepID=UPI002ED163A9
MNIKKAVACLFGFVVVSHAFAQQGPASGDGGGDIPLGGFPGCFVAPPKDACDARILCAGVGTLYGNTGADLQAATQEGSIEARNELAKFYSSKQKAEQSLSTIREDAQRSTSDGGKATASSAKRLIASVSSTSAESILSGVQVVSREVDTKQQTVTVKVGVSCKSQAAAAQSQAGATRAAYPQKTGGNGQAAAPRAEEYRTPPGQLSNFKQSVPHADEF